MKLNADTIIRDLFERARADKRCGAVAADLEAAWEANEWQAAEIAARLRKSTGKTTVAARGREDAAGGGLGAGGDAPS